MLSPVYFPVCLPHLAAICVSVGTNLAEREVTYLAADTVDLGYAMDHGSLSATMMPVCFQLTPHRWLSYLGHPIQSAPKLVERKHNTDWLGELCYTCIGHVESTLNEETSPMHL